MAVLREACAIDRVSIARLEGGGTRFEIAAEAGAELLAPGTTLPVTTCSYFTGAAEGRTFVATDLDAESTFDRPLDGVILATGYHAACSVPIHHDGAVCGAVSLSALGPREDMNRLAVSVAQVADLLGAGMAPAPTAPRALICDGDPLAARGIARLLEQHGAGGARVVMTAAEAVAAAAEGEFDVVVCADWVDGLRVDDLAGHLRAAGLDQPLLVVSARDAAENRRASITAGAAGHVARDHAVARLPDVLAAVMRGETVLPAPTSPATDLTHRESELLNALEEGLRFKQIAWRWGVSEATAKTHGRNLFRKLGATSRAEAVHAARKAGLLG